MDHYWLLTNTCYVTWLPGDERGFIGRVSDSPPEDAPGFHRIAHNVPGTRCDNNIPGLERAARNLLKGLPIHLTTAQAEVVVGQFQETASFRNWGLLAAAIMFNH